MHSRILRIALFLLCAGLRAQERPQDAMERAIADFRQGRINESVKGFDRVAELAPSYAPQLWQRGIALYYAGRFRDCQAQFESHRTVNPDDVENAAWHFLCVARAESPARAKAALLPVGPDPRVPMRQIYALFRGETRPEQVLAAGGSELEGQFYAHLYVGLYLEAMGDQAGAAQHLREAAKEKYSVGGYMHEVARVHVALLERQPKK